MASLPQYLMGQNQFDTTPLENGLAKFFQRQQWQQEQANKQRQLDFEAQRVGMDQQRLGWEGARQPGLLEHQNLQNRLMQGDVDMLPDKQRQIRAGIYQTEAQTRAANQQYDQLNITNPVQADILRRQRDQAKFMPVQDGVRLMDTDTRKLVDIPESPKVNPETMKLIHEADDGISAGMQALNDLKRIKQLSANAYDGMGASQRAYVVANTYGPHSLFTDTKRAQDTMLLDNAVKEQALSSLKTIFGGNPTEGERDILLKIQGSANLPREVRDQIYAKAEQLAMIRLERNRQTAAGLRNGTYFRPGGQPQALQQPQSGYQPSPPPNQTAPPPMPRTQADYDALPRGATYIAPDGSERTKK